MSSGARVALFIALVLGVWSLEHLYVGWRLLNLPWLARCGGGRGVLLLLITGFLAYPLGRILWHAWRVPLAPTLEWIGAVWMGVLFLLLAFLLLAELLSLGGLVGASLTTAIRSGAVVAALLASAVGLHGGLRRPRVVRVEVALPGLPGALDGLRLLQLSDLHLGTLTGRRFVDSLVDLAHGLDPDLIAVSGDLFDSDAETVEELVPHLKRLQARRGVFAVLGNHEYYAGAERCTRLMEAAGLVVLDNEARQVAPGLWLAGIPYRRGAGQAGRPGADLRAALAVVPEESAVVLLQHAPEREEEAAAAGVGLMLCGHTHGGQIWPFHLLVRRRYPHLAGIYKVGAMTEIVSRGAGRWGPPMRLLAPADVVLVTLRQPRGMGRSAPPDTGRSTPVR